MVRFSGGGSPLRTGRAGLGCCRRSLAAAPADGCNVAALYVDADSPAGAPALYEHMGFTKQRASATLIKDLAGQGAARSRWYQVPGFPPRLAGSAGPAGTNPALASTFEDAALPWETAALSVRSPYRTWARWQSSRTAVVATPLPAAS